MKALYRVLLPFLCVVLISACGKNKPEPNPDPAPSVTVEQRIDALSKILYSSSPVNPSITRKAAIIDSLQFFFDAVSKNDFSSYLSMSSSDAEREEKTNPAFCFYRKSFDKVLREVQSDTPNEGEVFIWLLYNMGYIIKTPKVCIGIDIYHKYADKLEPYLDFLLATHAHYDHYTQSLLKKMYANGKETAANANFKNIASLSHFLTIDPNYADLHSFKLKKGDNIIPVHSFTTDHYYDPKNIYYVSTFEMDLNSVGGDLILIDVGDSNYNLNQYKNRIHAAADAIKIFISRYPPKSNNYIDAEKKLLSSVVKPKYLLYSHFNELNHKYSTESEIRWFYPNGFNRAATINVDGLTVCIPIWGDKMIWKGGVLN